LKVSKLGWLLCPQLLRYHFFWAALLEDVQALQHLVLESAMALSMRLQNRSATHRLSGREQSDNEQVASGYRNRLFETNLSQPFVARRELLSVQQGHLPNCFRAARMERDFGVVA